MTSNRNVLDHPNSVSNNLVKHLLPGPINPNPVSCASISSIEVSVFVSINHTALYTPLVNCSTFLNRLALFSLIIVFK